MLTEYLNALKTGKNLSWQNISESSKVPVPTVRNIFSGESQSPGIQAVAAIVEGMGGSLDEAMGISTPQPRTEDILSAIYESRIEGIKQDYQDRIDELNGIIEQQNNTIDRMSKQSESRLKFILGITAGLIVVLDFLGDVVAQMI